MKITTTMDLGHLLERMGDTCGADGRTSAEHMRRILVAHDYEGQDTRDVPEAQWLRFVVLACDRAEGTAGVAG